MRKISFTKVHQVLTERKMENVLGGFTYHNPCNPTTPAHQCYGACMTSNGLGGVCRKVEIISDHSKVEFSLKSTTFGGGKLIWGMLKMNNFAECVNTRRKVMCLF